MSGDWSELLTPNLGLISLIKIKLTLKNARFTAFFVSVLLTPPPSPRLALIKQNMHGGFTRDREILLFSFLYY